MEALLKPDALSLFVFLVLPGYVAISAYDLVVPGPRRDFSKYAVELLSVGMANLALVAPGVACVRDAGWQAAHSFLWYLLLVFCLVVAPALEALLFIWLRTRSRLRRFLIHPTPMAWDHYFGSARRRGPLLIRFALRGGGWVGGLWGGGSFASSYPEKPQVYLAQQWRMGPNGEFETPSERTDGVLVAFSECAFVEMIAPEVVSDAGQGRIATAWGLPAGTGTGADGKAAE